DAASSLAFHTNASLTVQLILAFHQKLRDGFQGIRAGAEAVEMRKSGAHQSVCFFQRFIDTEEGGIGGFFCGDIFAGRLAELLGCLRDIEDVVDNLEGETDILCEAAKLGNGVGIGFSVEASTHHARGNQGCSLGTVNVLQHGEIGFRVFRFEIDDLTANHAVDGSGTVRNFLDDANPRSWGTAEASEYFVSMSLQGVAGEDGDGFAENLMASGPSAAEVVVIEGGQVVMNQGISVEHLKRGTQFLDSSWKRDGDQATGFHAQNRPNAFSTGEDAVAHGLVNGARML